MNDALRKKCVRLRRRRECLRGAVRRQALHRVYQELGGKGLEMFAISDEKAAVVAADKAKDAFGKIPVLLDEKREVFERHRVQGIPRTLVLDGKGRVVRHFTGPVKEDDLWTALRARNHEP